MRKKGFLLFLFTYSILYSIHLNATTIHVNNRFISYIEAGQGKPLVLIHAFPADKRLWAPQQEGLKQQFRVISLDLWGFGESAAVDGNAVTMTDYALEVKELLDYLHIEKAIIGGESMGGYIALAFLELYPHRVEGVILSNTQAVADSDEAKINREKNAIDVLENGTEKLVNGFMEKALAPSASEQTREVLAHILTRQKPTALASALRGMALRSPMLDLLANTMLPILIITSDQDKIISPLQSEQMQHLACNSKLVILENAGHLSNLEQPEEWNRAVKEWFFIDGAGPSNF
ncbi:alpha/beta fold hydrolase [Legionella saoudiensis]|uniref:alpha/beta fold hydrolase n=1 Tax=Legionella saoudiensis TaxID=1750561 RepID=UPI0007318157|nr:alpha/beta hydrolase [Legionella saoudiensis]